MLIQIALWLSVAAHATRSMELKPRDSQRWQQYYNYNTARIDNDYNYADDFAPQDGATYFQLLSAEVNSAELSNEANAADAANADRIPTVEGTREEDKVPAQTGAPAAGPTAGTTPCKHGSYHTSSKGCSTFQVCSRGALTETNCPAGMWFDPRHKDNVLCNHPEVVCAADNSVCDCAAQYPPLPPDPLIEASVTCLADNRFHFTGSQVDCGRYFVCFNEHVKRLECRDGFQYNALTEACDYPEIVNCQMTDPDCPAEGVSFLPHEELEDSFYFCVHGYKSEQTCPFYHIWDTATSTCKQRTDVEVKKSYKKGYY